MKPTKKSHSIKQIKLFFVLTLFAVLSVLVISSPSWATTYYVDATNGNDNNDGLSQSTAWETIAKVDSSTFQPGDSILFKKGETWRESLTVPSSGTSGSPITFGAYGSGGKPKILGSVAKNSTSDWEAEIVRGQANIWMTASTTDIGHIYADGNALGLKKSTEAECTSQGDFFWNSSDNKLYIYSTSNTTPTDLY